MAADISSSPHFPAAALSSFTVDALRACGLPPADAGTVAGAIVEADLTGADAHGIFRLPGYVAALEQGRINATAAIRLHERGVATALVDGDNGMGHLVASFAARTAVAIAREAGVAWVGARRSNHAGAAGVYAAIPLAQGMIGIYGAAASINHMAPDGGAEPLLGTNPIAIAIPAGREPPVLLDIATSTASFGAIRTAALEGRSVPAGWMIERATGAPLTDPARAAEALLVPIGGYKGAGLSLVIGLLGAVLNGAAFGRDLAAFEAGTRRESNTGQFVIALDIARFMDPAHFAAEVDRHLHDLRTSAPLPGRAAVRLPGMERQRRRAARLRDGVPLAAALVGELDRLAARLAIAPLGAR